MTTPEPPISPRGVPQIRTDWLIDVAWRLAELGLETLRGLPADATYELEDRVDGSPWRFSSERFSPRWSTSVEHDADLFIPTDTTTATLRAGFQFKPWWDPELGRCVQARVEIGPRGPVTFDPENWFVLLPLPGAERQAFAGVEPGAWNVGGTADGAPEPTLVEHAALVGQALSVADLGLLKPDASIPELVLSAGDLVRRRGLLGRGKLVPGDRPAFAAQVVAGGAIDVNWTGQVALPDLIDDGHLMIESVETGDGQVTLRGDRGALTLTGPQVALNVTRLLT